VLQNFVKTKFDALGPQFFFRDGNADILRKDHGIEEAAIGRRHGFGGQIYFGRRIIRSISIRIRGRRRWFIARGRGRKQGKWHSVVVLVVGLVCT